MIRIWTKHPDGKWCMFCIIDYKKDNEKIYAKSLVGMYREILDSGYILAFTVEILTTVENENFIEVMGYGGM